MFRYGTISLLLTFLLLQAGPNDAIYGRFGSGVIGYATSVNLNSVADTTVTVKSSKYVITKFRVTNCSTTPVLAQIALYTAAAAGGVNLVGAAVLTTLTSTPIYVDMTLINNTSALTASSLFVRNTVVQGSALTCDVYIFGDSLP